MSTQSNLEIVQGAYAAFQRGDIDGLLGVMADDVVWTVPEYEGPNHGGVYNGPAGVAKFFQTLMEDEEILEFVINDWIADGEKVVAVGRVKARVRRTGKTGETSFAHINTVKDGKVVNFFEIFDTGPIAAAHRAG